MKLALLYQMRPCVVKKLQFQASDVSEASGKTTNMYSFILQLQAKYNIRCEPHHHQHLAITN